MFYFMCFIAWITVIVILAINISNNKSNRINNIKIQNKNEEEHLKQINRYNFPYEKKYILTNNEYNFYKNLKNIAKKYNVQILAKVRLADLIDVKKGKYNAKQWGYYFNRIKSKHIDFVLVDDMKVIMLIELDDRTHQRQDRINRDDFIDMVTSNCGYELIHTLGETTEIDKVLNCLKPQSITTNEITV